MLTTQRLQIRPFIAEDGEELYDYLSDEKTVRYEPYPPLTRQEANAEAVRRAGDPDFFAVCLAETGRLIGNLYFSPRSYGNWELGYVFSSSHWHQGFATEAVKALLSHAFAGDHVHRVFAECNPQNSASWKLLERVGFRREGRLVKNLYFSCDAAGRPLWQDTFLYGLLAEEWRSINEENHRVDDGGAAHGGSPAGDGSGGQ